MKKVILISGSKASGGFVVARRSFLEQSTLSGILSNNPELAQSRTKPGELIRYTGRLDCWVNQHNGLLKLPAEIMGTFCIQPGDNLLIIRGSNLGFVCAKSGPLVKKARSFPGIPVFEYYFLHTFSSICSVMYLQNGKGLSCTAITRLS
jgi:hypothetical protein